MSSELLGAPEAEFDAIGHILFYNVPGEPSAPATPETKTSRESPFTRLHHTVVFSEEDLQDLPSVHWAPPEEEVTESSSVVTDSEHSSAEYARQHHHHHRSSSSSRKHRSKHDLATASITDGSTESLSRRSHSFSSGFDSSSVASSIALSCTSSFPGPSVSEVSYRPK